MKQLNKLIPVIKVLNLTPENSLTLELVLIKIETNGETNGIFKIAESFGATIIDVKNKTYTMQAVCDEQKLKALIELLKPIGIKELIRSGAVGISK